MSGGKADLGKALEALGTKEERESRATVSSAPEFVEARRKTGEWLKRLEKAGKGDAAKVLSESSGFFDSLMERNPEIYAEARYWRKIVEERAQFVITGEKAIFD